MAAPFIKGGRFLNGHGESMKTTILAVCICFSALGAPVSGTAGSGKILGDTVSISSWEVLLKASAQSLVDSLAILGVKPDATPGYDPAYDAPRPPDPPTDYVKVYFPHSGGDWPSILGNKWMIDVCSPQSPEWLMIVESSVGSIQVTLSWDTSGINSLPAGYSIMVYDSQASASFNLRSRNSYTFLYSGERKFSVWIDIGFTVIDISPRWNMISLPVHPENPSKSALFPDAVSDAFYYDGGYVTADTLEAGKGYWIKYDNAGLVYLSGLSVSTLNVPLKEGWNLIGVIDVEIPAPSGGVLVSDFFGYDGGYYSADTLKPGKGYWIKSSENGFINLESAH